MKNFKLDFIEKNIRYSISFNINEEKYNLEDFINKFLDFFSKRNINCINYNEYFIAFLREYKFSVEEPKFQAEAIFIEEKLYYPYSKTTNYSWNGNKIHIPLIKKIEEKDLQNFQSSIGDYDYYLSIFSISGYWEDMGECIFDSYHQITKRVKTDIGYELHLIYQTMGWCCDYSEGTTRSHFAKILVPFNQQEELKIENKDEQYFGVIGDEDDETDFRVLTTTISLKMTLPIETPFPNVNLVKNFKNDFMLLKNIESIKTLEEIKSIINCPKKVIITMIEKGKNIETTIEEKR